MKKEYIKPEVVVEEILQESVMMANSQEINPDETGKPRANEYRRGSWGNLWED